MHRNLGHNHPPGPAATLRVVVLVTCLTLTLWTSLAAATPAAWTIGPSPSWTTRVDVAPTSSTASGPSGNAERDLLFDEQTRVADDVESYTHVARLIANEAGLDASSQVTVLFDPSYQTLVLHYVRINRGAETFDRLAPAAVKLVQREPNLEAQTVDGRQSAVLFLSDLRVGDVVDYAYTLRGRDPTMGGHFAGGVPLGGTSPVAHLHARLLLTQGRHVHLRVHAGEAVRSALERTPVVRGDDTEYVWDLHDVPAYLTEPNAPAWYSPYPWVQVSDFDWWADVSKWGASLFDVGAPRRGPLNDWVASQQKASASPDEFLLRAIRFVQDEVRYVGIEVGMSRRRPAAPDVVFDRRYGDCKDKTALLVAILKVGGVRASPALVASNGGPVASEWAPSPAVFDHAIVLVEPPTHESYWVDTTVALQGGGLARLQYSPFWSALVLSPDGANLTSLEDAPATLVSPSIRDHFTVTLPDASEETRLDSDRTYEGVLADGIRAGFRGVTADALAKYFLGLYQPDYPGIREIAPLEQMDDRAGDSFRLVLHYSIPKFWKQPKADEPYRAEFVAHAIPGYLERLPTRPRTAPLAIPFPLHARATIDLDLPFDLKAAPQKTSVTSDGFVLDFSSSYRDRRESYTFELVMKAATVDAAAVPVHMEKVDAARALLSRALTYRSPQMDGVNWSGLLAFFGCVPFIVWGAYRVYRHDPRPPRDALPIDPGFAGLRGWLLLVAFNVLLAPFVTAWQLSKSAHVLASLSVWRTYTTPEVATYSPGVPILLVGESVAQSWLLAYGVVIALLFIKKRRTFPIHYMVYLIAFAVFGPVDRVLASLAGLANDSAETTLGMIRRLLGAMVWIPYINFSLRVRNTFVERRRRRRRTRPAEARLAATSAEEALDPEA